MAVDLSVSEITSELGAVRYANEFPSYLTGGRKATSWSSFIDEVERVPQLAWPASIGVTDEMRSDAQIESLYDGTALMIRGMRVSIDPNGAPAATVERACRDTGLPVKGRENEPVRRSAYRFNFDEHLSDALLALLYGHFYFEQVGYIGEDEWLHLRKLAPRHPRTIGDFDIASDGGLRAIRQNLPGQRSGPLGVGGYGGAVIPIEKLVAFVWGREAGSWIGRSMLRPLRREFLVKDRLIRVDAVNHERAGGVPVAEGPPGATDGELKRLAMMARQFKVTEGGGGAIPNGSKMHLVRAGGTDVIASVRYCDESMARRWMLMLVQLGQTETGSRALGGTFENVAGAFRDAIAKWFRKVWDEHVLEDLVAWNEGETAEYAPRLHFEPPKSDAPAVDGLVQAIDSGLLVVDPSLRAWARGEWNLPPEDVETIAQQEPGAQLALPPGPSARATGTRTRRPARQVRATLTLPDRELRRQPYDVEVQAAVDFRSLDVAHDLAATGLEALYLERVIPAQIAEIAAAITTTKAGTERVRVTRAAMAGVTASSYARDELADLLLAAARAGAQAAVREVTAQGVAAEMPGDEVLAGLVGDQADAVSQMAAHGISLAAQRRAVQSVGGRSAGEIAAEVTAHLQGMKHTWTVDQLKGAVTMAQNVARTHVFAQALEQTVASIYASEILDVNTCPQCMANDGREYDSIEAAVMDYASGGFHACDGGPRCRGTLVFVRATEIDPASSAHPLLPSG